MHEHRPYVRTHVYIYTYTYTHNCKRSWDARHPCRLNIHWASKYPNMTLMKWRFDPVLAHPYNLQLETYRHSMFICILEARDRTCGCSASIWYPWQILFYDTKGTGSQTKFERLNWTSLPALWACIVLSKLAMRLTNGNRCRVTFTPNDALAIRLLISSWTRHRACRQGL